MVLFRPVGQAELDLIRKTGWRRFPPRLPGQPIFYPVVHESYAVEIARRWNAKDEASGFVGYVVRFEIEDDYIAGHETHVVGDSTCVEYWIAAEHLEQFNDRIQGVIEIVSEWRN